MSDTSEKENSIIDSFKNVFKERLNSCMYGTFIISWCIWNWEAIYLTLFIDQSLLSTNTGFLKIDYLFEMYHWLSPDGWALSIVGLSWFMVRILIGPFISALVITWWVSKIDFEFYVKNLKNEESKKIALFNRENKVLDAQKGNLEIEEENIKIKKSIEKERPEKDRWDVEFEKIKNNDNFKEIMNSLKKCLYEHNGKLIASGVAGGMLSEIFRMPPEVLVYLDVNGLIEFVDGSKKSISSTSKGKYFIKKYIDEKI
jgi:hypothetical protein